MKFYFPNISLIIIFSTLFYSYVCAEGKGNRSFVINYENNTFLKDGEAFRYISGSIHYFRLVEEYWDRTLRKIRLGGFNAITTYVEWQSHQPDPSLNFVFEGNLNVFKFLDLAQKNGLLVILRVGPYEDAERDMGGLPPWLLWQNPNIKLRTSDLDYVYHVSRWFDHLLPLVKPYLYENGGPIIMVQVENEYGSYGCDKNYTVFVRDLIRFHLGDNVVLFTTDGAGDNYLKCGAIPDVYPTVDFGPELDAVVDLSFAVQRRFAPKGPLINSEYYPGWLDHWQEPHSKRSQADVVSTLDKILSMGANVNMYMVYGGTSFGFGAGANIDGKMYEACPTSYDYDAPINEAGDPTAKYFGVKKVISKYMPVPGNNPVVQPKAAYGKVILKPFSHILHPEFLSVFEKKPVVSKYPLSFEQLKVGSGFVVYTTTVTFLPSDPALISMPDLKDRAYIYVNDVFASVLSRTENIFSKPLLVRKGDRLNILVENQGRVCFGQSIGESKGMGAKVTLGGTDLTNWTMYRLGTLNGTVLSKYSYTASTSPSNTNDDQEDYNYFSEVHQDFSKHMLTNHGGGSLLVGNFTVKANADGKILDTFINFDGFWKGIVWINDFNLGKYWPVVGPQQTLYLPAPLLKAAPAQNKVVVLELEWTPEPCHDATSATTCHITLTDSHIIDGPTPYKGVSKMRKHTQLQLSETNDV